MDTNTFEFLNPKSIPMEFENKELQAKWDSWSPEEQALALQSHEEAISQSGDPNYMELEEYLLMIDRED